LVILDPSLKRGFTSVPNAVLFAPDLSMAAKCLYAVILGFAWQQEYIVVVDPAPGLDDENKPANENTGSSVEKDGAVSVNGSGWMYSPLKEEIDNKKDKSYYDYGTGSDGTIFVDIKWAQILSGIRNVELDLSPIEKVLNWKFPDQPGQVQEIMDYAWQVAEKTRDSNRTERLPWRDFYASGCTGGV